jgi:hypothetical protein
MDQRQSKSQCDLQSVDMRDRRASGAGGLDPGTDRRCRSPKICRRR